MYRNLSKYLRNQFKKDEHTTLPDIRTYYKTTST